MFRPHQLELFYYVARYGGISVAVRHIPYGIRQPAVSGQMIEFERELGVPLFHRRPFQLTEQGQAIYEHIRPFHEGLPALWARVKQQPAQTVRIAVAGTVGLELLSTAINVLPAPLREVRLELLTGRPAELEARVKDRSVQLAITPAARRVTGICSRVLALAGLRLLVPRRADISSAGYFWSQNHIAETLICPPEADPVCRQFRCGLKALQVEWNPGIVAESSAALMQLVAGGHGVGVGLDLPWLTPPPEVRSLPLTGFAKVPLLALWRKPESAVISSVLEAAAEAAKG